MFKKRISIEQVEESSEFAPKFDEDGLIPVVTTSAHNGDVLMVGVMNREALENTIRTGEAWYWSRSRECLWHKGATSGLIQKIVEMRIDDDQDAVWLKVDMEGKEASCHVGYRSCFYRAVPVGSDGNDSPILEFKESEKTFDPKETYGDVPNPTKL